jgi:lipoprotein signal peptidase
VIVLASLAVLVAVLDGGSKALLERRLGSASVPLGPWGRLEVVEARVWWHRATGGAGRAWTWALWVPAAGGLLAASALAPSLAPSAGLLLGGSFAHALESTVRGSVRDWIRLRFWPAFDLADVAIAAGAIGLLLGTPDLARALAA